MRPFNGMNTITTDSIRGAQSTPNKGVPFINTSGEIIPPYAVMEVTEGGLSDLVVKVKKPTADSINPARLLFNGGLSIGAGSTSTHYAQQAENVIALLDQYSNLAIDGTETPLGTKTAQWYLTAGQEGFRPISGSKNDGTLGRCVRVRPFRTASTAQFSWGGNSFSWTLPSITPAITDYYTPWTDLSCWDGTYTKKLKVNTTNPITAPWCFQCVDGAHLPAILSFRTTAVLEYTVTWLFGFAVQYTDATIQTFTTRVNFNMGKVSAQATAFSLGAGGPYGDLTGNNGDSCNFYTSETFSYGKTISSYRFVFSIKSLSQAVVDNCYFVRYSSSDFAGAKPLLPVTVSGVESLGFILETI